MNAVPENVSPLSPSLKAAPKNEVYPHYDDGKWFLSLLAREAIQRYQHPNRAIEVEWQLPLPSGE
jgi:hypothetical protein